MKFSKIKYRDFILKIQIMIPYIKGDKYPSEGDIVAYFKESINDYDISDFEIKSIDKEDSK